MRNDNKSFNKQALSGEISVSYGGKYDDVSLLYVAPYSMVDIYRSFERCYCLHHQGEE
jgi:hypothetical protein